MVQINSMSNDVTDTIEQFDRKSLETEFWKTLTNLSGDDIRNFRARLENALAALASTLMIRHVPTQQFNGKPLLNHLPFTESSPIYFQFNQAQQALYDKVTRHHVARYDRFRSSNVKVLEWVQVPKYHATIVFIC